MRTIVLASRNAGKIRELAVLLEPFGVTVKGLGEYPEIGEIEETGSTFAENALLKAATVSNLTGCVAVADDSGLEVDHLGGEPGIYSARYSEKPGSLATDERNTQKVLDAMRMVPEKDRVCRFISVIAAAAPNKLHILAEGKWEGVLAFEPKGTNGFGYDPVFFDPDLGKTAAEMAPEEKNARSHRALACKKLLELWPSFWKD
jgi:XTP/dITP diphosphohydrolase